MHDTFQKASSDESLSSTKEPEAIVVKESGSPKYCRKLFLRFWGIDEDVILTMTTITFKSLSHRRR